MTPLSNLLAYKDSQLAWEREMNPQKRKEYEKKFNLCTVKELIMNHKKATKRTLTAALHQNGWPIFDPLKNAFLTYYPHSYSKESVRYSEWKFVWLKVGA